MFHEFGDRATFRGMVDAVMDTEAPLREEIPAQRIARAHGWLRTGGKVRERIQLHLRDLDGTSESGGEFLWRPGTIAPIHPYRAGRYRGAPRHFRYPARQTPQYCRRRARPIGGDRSCAGIGAPVGRRAAGGGIASATGRGPPACFYPP